MFDKQVSKQDTPDGWTVRWKVVPMFVDEYTPREYQTVLVQGLENASHRLELLAIGKEKPSIQAIRVYTPPLLSR